MTQAPGGRAVRARAYS